MTPDARRALFQVRRQRPRLLLEVRTPRASSCGPWTPTAPAASMVRTGPKLDYCFRDLERVRAYARRSAASTRAARRSAAWPATGSASSRGWADVYPSTYPENWIDVTGLKGCFSFIHRADPLGKIAEEHRATTSAASTSACLRAAAPRRRRLPLGGLSSVVVGVDDVLGLVGRTADRVLHRTGGPVDLALVLEPVVARQRARSLLDPALGVVLRSVTHVVLLRFAWSQSGYPPGEALPRPMDDQQIQAEIDRLEERQRELRHKESDLAEQPEAVAPLRDELETIRIELDRLWDLHRQRRALRDSGGNPDDASERAAGTVEGYLS